MSIGKLGRYLVAVEDPRCSGKVEHRLVEVLVIAVCAVIACAESWDDIALARSIVKCDNLTFPACWHQETAMAAAGFQHLTLDERRSLFRMQEAQLGVTEMAARLGRHRSTIYRELGRNRFRDPDASLDSRRNMSGYYPVTAQELARTRRQRLAKLARHEELLAHVVDRLRAGWSRQQIAGRLWQKTETDGEESERLCHETIYRHVYGPEGRAEQLHLCLPRARRRRGTRHGRRPRGHRIPLERGIACRPAEVATRERFGHWEGDLLVFARSGGDANVTTLLKRRSRFLVLLPNPDRRPAGVAERIGTALGGLAQDLRVTMTFDRGFEFMGYAALDHGLTVTSYFCDPRSPWQKGAVENANGRLRRYLPSDASADRLTACKRWLTGSTLHRVGAWATGRRLRCSMGVSIPPQTEPPPVPPCRIRGGKCNKSAAATAAVKAWTRP